MAEKFLVVGDPHAKRNNTNDIRKLADELVKLHHREDFDAIVIMGDLANDFDRMQVDQWLAIQYFLYSLMEVCLSVYYIVGNHDIQHNSLCLTDKHFFAPFAQPDKKGLEIVDTSVKRFFINDLVIYGVPYVPPGKFNQVIRDSKDIQEDWQDVQIIFAHQEFRGAKMGHIESTVGDEWNVTNPLVISGHIHDRDWLQDNILYVGAPYQTSYADNGNKTVEIVHIDNDRKITTEPVALDMPGRITKKLDYEGFKNLKLTEADLKKNYYRLNIADSTENITKLKKSKKYKMLSKSVKVVFKPTDVFVKQQKNDRHTKTFDAIVSDKIKQEGSQSVEELYHTVYKEVYLEK